MARAVPIFTADGLVQVDVARIVRGDAQLTLLDATGRVILNQVISAASTALNTRAVPRGLYTLRVVLPWGNVYTQSVSISH